MALRIRENGDILCAALHEEKKGDTYIPDNISEILTGCTGEPALLTTDAEPIHSTHGQWWWVGAAKVKSRVSCPVCGKKTAIKKNGNLYAHG